VVSKSSEKGVRGIDRGCEGACGIGKFEGHCFKPRALRLVQTWRLLNKFI
jgi:hypothetical protein